MEKPDRGAESEGLAGATPPELKMGEEDHGPRGTSGP